MTHVTQSNTPVVTSAVIAEVQNRAHEMRSDAFRTVMRAIGKGIRKLVVADTAYRHRQSVKYMTDDQLRDIGISRGQLRAALDPRIELPFLRD